MAKVVLSGIIQSISGSMGEITFVRHPNGIYVRRRVRKIKDTNSYLQQEVRKKWKIVATAWKNLDETHKAIWEEYGKRFEHRISGANAFAKLNKILLNIGLEMIKIPPLTWNAPPAIATDIKSIYSDKIEFNIWLPHYYKKKCYAQIYLHIPKFGLKYICIYPAPIVELNKPTHIIIDKIRIKDENKNIIEKDIANIHNLILKIGIRTVSEIGTFSFYCIHKIRIL